MGDSSSRTAGGYQIDGSDNYKNYNTGAGSYAIGGIIIYGAFFHD
jgi:hypothetical protein